MPVRNASGDCFPLCKTHATLQQPNSSRHTAPPTTSTSTVVGCCSTAAKGWARGGQTCTEWAETARARLRNHRSKCGIYTTGQKFVQPAPIPSYLVSQSVSVRYKETPRGPANPMLTPGPNPCPAFETQGATNLPQVSPTTCSTQAELASNMYKA
jgi:hypothetical protein